MPRVLIICGDLPPFPGHPGSGAGLRAYGLGRGLAAKGHEVVWAVPRAALREGIEPPPQVAEHLFQREELPEFIAERRPDVVVFQHWTMLFGLKPIETPTVIDLHGPTLLETLYQDNPGLDVFMLHKIHAFRRADFFTCAGELQKHYWYPWLLLAERDLRQDLIATVPLSLSPKIPGRKPSEEPTLVYGGFFLPWQDPVWALERTVRRLEERGVGRLLFFGGKHPMFGKMDSGVYDRLEKTLRASDRVRIMGVVSREELLGRYASATAAVDLMGRNPERELAFNSRTVEYLWAGLPVIHQPWSELAGLIGEYEAGWLVEVGDGAALDRALDEALDDPGALARKSDRAQELVRERLCWDKTIDPLDEFVRNPRLTRPDGFDLDLRMKRSPGRTLSVFSSILFDQGPAVFWRRLKERIRARN